ncbi:GAF domain-containing sensor histidine kinase [Candidatus Sumerlaeota bacterium]|nr:GAF domain-containing sensor histidine kinase [Candidatus Sumerlaeota bacterium]
MKDGNFEFDLPITGEKWDRIAHALNDLRSALVKRSRETFLISQIKDRINSGMTLDEILNYCFESFREIIPYNRIGFAVVEEDGKSVRAVWARSDARKMILEKDYSASLTGSSLERIMQTGNPRILNDLEEYFRNHPQSLSTKKVIDEGMRSSLTCPLMIKGKPAGFLFFSSMKTNTYKDIHIEIFREIAEQAALILEKGRLYQWLHDLNELKNTLLGIAAHDLKNPIGVIKGFSELLMDGVFGSVTEQQKKYILRIHTNCDAMLKLINDLLEISAIESGKLELSLQEIDPASYLEEFHEYSRIMARQKGINMVINAPKELPKAVLDPNRINQVLNNLVSNAIKYSYPETTITLKARVNDAKYLEITVQDQGQGISEEYIPLLFRDYQKAGSRPTGGEQSSGLGLAIVRRIVRAHEGHFHIESKLGEGSVFSIALPLKGPQKQKADYREL